jgi:hypothetical protein
MRGRRLHWQDSYKFVGPNITADGVRINYPFDPTFPADVGFYEGAGRHLVRPNRQEYLEAIYLYSGSLDVQIRDRRFHLKKGDVVVIDARANIRFIEGRYRVKTANPTDEEGNLRRSEDDKCA